MTIFLTMSMAMFLTFCLVLVEGARIYFLKMKALQAMELAEFSVLSEFQQELFEHYGVFFLDLDYEQGRELVATVEKRAEKYLLLNAEQVQNIQVCADDFRRATDGGGERFFRQAVEFQKTKSGYKFLEDLIADSGSTEEELPDLGALLEEYEGEAESRLGEYVDAEGFPLFDISLPNISFPSVSALNQAVFGDVGQLSEKSVDLKERIGRRTLMQGTGKREEIGLLDMQWFHWYLLEHYSHYGSENAEIPKKSLEYQLEYILSGQESDKKNLESVMWKIFVLRAGGNYLFYHQDSEKLLKAEAAAVAIAGITINPIIIGAVKEMILISWAIDDGISDTKKIFAGEKVPLYQQGIFAGVDLGYQEYLYLFLNVTGSTDKIYRSMDVAEMEVRILSEYENFRMDHCTDAFEIQWTYGFESLFEMIPMMGGGTYENTMKRMIAYET